MIRKRFQEWIEEKETEEKKRLLKEAGLLKKVYIKKWKKGCSFDEEEQKYYVYEDDVDLSALTDEEYKKIQKYVQDPDGKMSGSGIFFALGVLIILLGIAVAIFNESYTVAGIAIAISSIPFFALSRIINLLIDIYNKIK